MNKKKSIVIIGGGASALMLACSLDAAKYSISIYEKNAALGRKFLVAGKGGFNLTHSEGTRQFLDRYTPKQFIDPFFNHFSNTDFRHWLTSIGIDTYVGTSKRVFPVKAIKPIQVLNAIEKQLIKNNVALHFNHSWNGWSENALQFLHHNQTLQVNADLVVFAMGGASWKVTGSDGNWTTYFNEKGINTHDFYPSNCAYQINWNSDFIKTHQGQALKNCEFTCGAISRKGEAVITEFGIEGSGIYALSPEIRKEWASNPPDSYRDSLTDKAAEIKIDFKPDLSVEEIKNRLDSKGKLSIKAVLEKKINLSSTQIELLKLNSSKEDYNNAEFLSKLIKSCPLNIVGLAPIDEAISTVGGISLDEVTDNLELKKLPNHYCMGEMLDWDAPTGGYLLQACFSMGKFVADQLNVKTQ